MSKKEKLIHRFLSKPKDFTFDELIALFGYFGFTQDSKGKTSGSRIEFENTDLGLKYLAHKPHPDKVIKSYVIKQVKEFFKENKLL